MGSVLQNKLSLYLMQAYSYNYRRKEQEVLHPKQCRFYNEFGKTKSVHPSSRLLLDD
jgi:hypothetical protein